jgi:tRNA (mo5U34)-methyltransferase
VHRIVDYRAAWGRMRTNTERSDVMTWCYGLYAAAEEREKMADISSRANFDALQLTVPSFRKRLTEIRAEDGVSFPWYKYDSMNNIHLLARILPAQYDHVFAPGRRIADIGAGDGDFAFFLANNGHKVDIFDWPLSNMNGLQAAYYLKNRLKSQARIFSLDLDTQFRMFGPYDVAMFLGILYHLKNPFYALEELSRNAKFMFLTTKVVRAFRQNAPDISEYAAAYLVTADECGHDPSNFWMFTETGLRRILDRSGWNVIECKSNNVLLSNPQDIDERSFVFASSRHLVR